MEGGIYPRQSRLSENDGRQPQYFFPRFPSLIAQLLQLFSKRSRQRTTAESFLDKSFAPEVRVKPGIQRMTDVGPPCFLILTGSLDCMYSKSITFCLARRQMHAASRYTCVTKMCYHDSFRWASVAS